MTNISHSFNSDLKNYADAQEFCETMAMNRFTTGRLFEPMTSSFFEEVKTESHRVFGKLRYRAPWIGIRRKGGYWVYRSSETKVKFQIWKRDLPTPKKNKKRDCVSFGFTGKWNNSSCQAKTYFICEFA